MAESTGVSVGITHATSFTDEDNPIIKYYNSYGNRVSSIQVGICLTGIDDVLINKDVSIAGGEYTFVFTDEERSILLINTPKRSRTVYYIIQWLIDGTIYYKTYPRTFSVVNAEPTLAPTIVDINTVTTGLTGDNSILIKEYSRALITYNITARKHRTISEVKIYGVYGNYSIKDLESHVDYTVIRNEYKITAYTTDSFSTTVTVPVTLIDYFKPSCNLNVSGMTGDGDAALTVSGICFNGSFGIKNNDITVYYRYKEVNGEFGDWIAASYVQNGNSYMADLTINGLNYQNTYIVQAKIVDALEEIYSAERTIVSTPIFDWGSDNFNFNIPVNMNSGATIDGDLVLSGSAEIQGNVTVIGNSDFQNDATFGDIYLDTISDKNGSVLLAPKASYTTAGIDPDTTLDHLILTNVNIPSTMVFAYVKTEFYGSRTVTSNRMQTAFSYRNNAAPQYRYYYNQVWSDWIPIKTASIYTVPFSNLNAPQTGDIWINGKPIYRMVYQEEVTTVNSTVEIGSIYDFGEMVRMYGSFRRTGSGSSLELNYYHSSSDYNYTYVNSSGIINLRTSTAGIATVIAEYTLST